MAVIFSVLMGLASCSVKKGGKRHRKPSGGSGKGCDCPTFGQSVPDDSMMVYRFQPEEA